MSNDDNTLAQWATAFEHQVAATELAGIVTDYLAGPVAADVPPAEPGPRAPLPDLSQGSGSNGPQPAGGAQLFANFLTTALYEPFAGRPE